MIQNIPLGKTGTLVPPLGFGTWQLTGEQCKESVAHALGVGYKHIDTADGYDNHQEVGQGIKQSGLKREDYFLTTKITNHLHDRAGVLESGERFLKELDIPYIDLLLIHWPIKSGAPVIETLEAMQELKERGLIRFIGVSNFTEHHLRDAEAAGVEMVNNQVETRPQWKQKALRDFCASKNISVTAYSSLRGGDAELPLVAELAGKYGKTPAQIILNWVLSRGMFAIPKSSRPERIEENFAAGEFEMDKADLAQIDSLPDTRRSNVPSFGEFDY